VTETTTHFRDDQLLLYSSGELHDTSNALIAAHIKSCSQCKGRLDRLESTLAEVTHAQRPAVTAELPSAAGPRALLKAQLANLSAGGSSTQEASTPKHPNGAVWPLNWPRSIVFASLTLVVMLLVNRAWHPMDPRYQATPLAEEPNTRFTPGAVVATTESQVCADSFEAPAIPAAMKTRVLQLYGVASEQSDAYEVDFLITPELGGATDIRNLWPEPYNHTMWNAHVKDRLENRLREMVCHGDLDLATAQRDISTDWIAAYRKYFHVDTPVVTGSS
jgi:hypothetical protein